MPCGDDLHYNETLLKLNYKISKYKVSNALKLAYSHEPQRK
jgi:hypothetical protein